MWGRTTLPIWRLLGTLRRLLTDTVGHEKATGVLNSLFERPSNVETYSYRVIAGPLRPPGPPF